MPLSPSDSVPTVSRRDFVAAAGAVGLAATTGLSTLTAATPPVTMIQNTFLVHHVFFWLKNPDSEEDLTALLDGIRSLGEIPEVRGVHVGVPADTEKREVVENSYHASEILLFDSLADQAKYQEHPLHHKFIKDHAHRWDKVTVFDTVRA